jgi:hypothetical protein
MASMNYQIQVTDAELNLIGAALMRVPTEQLALIDKLRAQAMRQEAAARAEASKANGGAKVVDIPVEATEVPLPPAA